jgi:hypothetical protein
MLAVLSLMATQAFGSEDYVLYERTGAAISGFVPSGTYAWAGFTASLDLDLNEQLAYRELQLAWLKTDLDQAIPTREARVAAHLAILDRFISRVDARSVQLFRKWVQAPGTVRLSSKVEGGPPSAELSSLLAAFRASLLGSAGA